MSYKVTLNNPKFPKGTKIAVGNYFCVVNGESTEVSNEVAERYKNATGKTLKQGLSKGFVVEVVAAKSTTDETTKGGESN